MKTPAQGVGCQVRSGRLLYSARGSVMVESTMALVFLLGLMFGAIQLSLLSYQKASLSYALNRGLRRGAVAQALNPQLFRGWLVNEVRTVGLSDNNLQINFCALEGQATSGCVPDSEMDATSQSGQFTLVQARLSSPIIFGLGSIPVNVTAIRRFE